jgi:Na+-driven multidrug efflux pump
LGFACLALADQIFGIYSKSPEVIAAAKERAWVIIPTYFMCGIMNVFTGSVRGYGYSLLPTFISAVGILATRITWIFTVFARYHDIKLLYLSWGVSYLVVIIALVISYVIIHRRLIKKSAQSILQVQLQTE